MTATIGRPASLAILTFFICAWMGVNTVMPFIGKVPFDPVPFPYLFGGISLMSLYVAVLILTTQRRADKLASRREQMTLELAFLSEHKTAKIIALLEELRLDSPDVRNRVDKEANAMATPADALAVHEETVAIEAEAGGGGQTTG